MSQLAQVRSARAAVAGDTVEQVQEAEDNEGHRVLTASAPVAPLGWLVFVETPIQEAYAPLYAAMQRTGLVLLGALALAFAAAMFLARRMVVPIQALRSGAARLGSGDLGQRIAIKTGDELEALADQFNDMAGRLQELYANLEKKVELRTRELSELLEQQTATSGGIADYQFIAGRTRTGVRDYVAERGPNLRCKVRQSVAAGGRFRSYRRRLTAPRSRGPIF